MQKKLNKIANDTNLFLKNFIKKQKKSELMIPMKYGLFSGGKKIRSKIFIDVGLLFKINYRALIIIGSAVECIHAYSLIHDDLPAMDDDDIRHNQPTSHRVYGEAQAILAGDALQALAFQVICNDPLLDYETKVKLIGLLSESSYKMAEGQSIDLSIVSQNVELDLLNDMHKKKTGALLGLSLIHISEPTRPY